jgi:hypothetical protein
MTQYYSETFADEWVTFPGGELEAKRPRTLCAACREALKRSALEAGGKVPAGKNAVRQPLCFQCYRADLDRDRALRAAANLDTGSSERFQAQLPFEAVDHVRLGRLKSARASARAATARCESERRRAQIDARHALQHVAAGLRARGLRAADGDRAIFEAVHAAELQLPEAWLPFVVAR